jgi:hypothetical protein
MEDKGLGVGIGITFGISGILVVALAWLMPALHLDKAMATLGGLFGMGVAAFQGRKLKRENDAQNGRETVEVEIEE